YAEIKGSHPLMINRIEGRLRKASFLDRQFLARVHGSVEYPEDMVICSRHYDELEKDNYYQDFLYDLFSRKQVLFIGFSFLDPAILSVLSLVKSRLGSLTEGDHM